MSLQVVYFQRPELGIRLELKLTHFIVSSTHRRLKMKRNIALGVVLLAAALFAAPRAKADAVFAAILLGASEVPPNTSPAFGSATVTITGDSLFVSVSFFDLLSPPSARRPDVHQHQRPYFPWRRNSRSARTRYACRYA